MALLSDEELAQLRALLPIFQRIAEDEQPATVYQPAAPALPTFAEVESPPSEPDSCDL